MSGVEQIVLSNRKYSPDSYFYYRLAAEESFINALRIFQVQKLARGSKKYNIENYFFQSTK